MLRIRFLIGGLLAGALVVGAQSPATGDGINTPDTQEIRNYRLTLDKVDRFAAASHALMNLAKTQPELRSALGGDSNTKTINDSVARLESRYPQAAAAIQKSGLTNRDYLLTSINLFMATMTVGMKRHGQLRGVPASISAENLAFVEQNYTKIEKLMRGLSQMDDQ